MPPSSQLARALGGGSGAAVGLHWGGRGSRLGGAGWDFNGSSAFGHVGGQGPRAGDEKGTGGPKRALCRSSVVLKVHLHHSNATATLRVAIACGF